MGDDFGSLYKRQIPHSCRWCDADIERIPVKKEGSKTSFVFGCRNCDMMWCWPIVENAA